MAIYHLYIRSPRRFTPRDDMGFCHFGTMPNLMEGNRIGGSMNIRKFFLIIFFILFLLSPLHLQGKQFFVKMAFGLTSGGNVEDALLAQTEYIDYVSMGEEKRSNIGQDVYLECAREQRRRAVLKSRHQHILFQLRRTNQDDFPRRTIQDRAALRPVHA